MTRQVVYTYVYTHVYTYLYTYDMTYVYTSVDILCTAAPGEITSQELLKDYLMKGLVVSRRKFSSPDVTSRDVGATGES